MDNPLPQVECEVVAIDEVRALISAVVVRSTLKRRSASTGPTHSMVMSPFTTAPTRHMVRLQVDLWSAEVQ
jgi:hypothetical protein